MLALKSQEEPTITPAQSPRLSDKSAKHDLPLQNHIDNKSPKEPFDSALDDRKVSSADHPDERRHPSPLYADRNRPAAPPFDPYTSQSVGISSTLPSILPMPHRVESLSSMSTTHRRPYDHPSPPPIATLTHSPALSVSSLDRSSINTPPPPRRSPPNGAIQPPMYSYSVDAQNRHHYSQHGTERPEGLPSQYGYTMTNYSDHPSYQITGNGQNQMSVMHQPHSTQGRDPYLPYPLPGQNNLGIIHTDDAATKLSDRVRRRCFNCCTTDTSTWRRSNLSPGKVLCNKCGLFERTHSRPRPEQFPHKRGPLATSALRSRTPPQTHLPPIHSHTLPPYHYNHPSIAPLSSSVTEPRRQYSAPGSQHNSTATALPGVQSWLNEPPSHSVQPPTARRPTLESNGQPPRQLTPPASRPQQQQQPALEAQDQPSGHD